MILRETNVLISSAIVLAGMAGVCASAESLTPTIVRIEQDWKVELYSTSNDANKNSPQIVSAFKLPNGTDVFQVTWNHIDSPSFIPGGFQLQAWAGGALVDSIAARKPLLSAANDVLIWTQVVTTTSSQQATEYALEVKNVSSSSWGGSVTGDQVLKVSLSPSANLNDYSAAACLEDSAIIVGTNRVKWYGIVETRFYDQEGNLIARDTSTKTVFQQDQHFSYYELKKLDWTGTVKIDSQIGSVTLAPSGTALVVQ